MGAHICKEDMDELAQSMTGCCQRFRVWINNLCGYYKNEKEHMQ